jgi:CRISPR/Cas system CMR-associated protein Cmr3 (group 5 of RAMP superfamily)
MGRLAGSSLKRPAENVSTKRNSANTQENKDKQSNKKAKIVEEDMIEVACVKLKIDDNMHPFYEFNGLIENTDLNNIVGYKEKKITKQDVRRYNFKIIKQESIRI